MIHIRVEYPRAGSYRSYRYSYAVYTDSIDLHLSGFIPAEPVPMSSFDMRERWAGDTFSEGYPWIKHIKRDCHHNKLTAELVVRPRPKTDQTQTFSVLGFDPSLYDRRADNIFFDKDDGYILHGGKRPLSLSTNMGSDNPVVQSMNSSFATLATLDRDRYHSMAPWRYYQIIYGISATPVTFTYHKKKIVGMLMYSFSFSSRWEAGVEPNWSSDESVGLFLRGTSQNWDFLAGEYTNRTPYNRIFRSGLATTEIQHYLESPVLPQQFKIPTKLPWDWTETSGEVSVKIFGFNVSNFRTNIYPVLAQRVNSLACRASSCTLPKSTHQKDLHLQIIENLRTFNSNFTLYFKDLPGAGGTIQTVVNSLRTRSVADVSAVWLSARFADRLTFADTKELVDSLKEALNRESLVWNRKVKRYARDTVSYTTEVPDLGSVSVREVWNSHAFFTPHVPHNEEAYRKLVQLLQEWDIVSLENVWDAIPYSFVVDWIVNVAGCLDIIDANVQTWAYDITDICDSVKRIVDLRPNFKAITSADVDVRSLTYSTYDRVYPESLKLPIFTQPLEPVGDGLHNWKHIIDIGMLVIQRLA